MNEKWNEVDLLKAFAIVFIMKSTSAFSLGELTLLPIYSFVVQIELARTR